jgi:hypothetical protein
MRQKRDSSSPSRWTWLISLAATAFIAACDTSLEGFNQEQTWGFVTVAANKSGTAHFADAEGLFFKGTLGTVPNAEFAVADTCTDTQLSGGNNLEGVTYLDAGPSVAATFGGVAQSLDRTTTAEGIAYLPGNPIAYTPGDSIVVTVTGASGGFPAGSIRAKTAEAFDFPTSIDVPAGSDSILLNWTPPHDPRSALVVSLRYATNTTPTVLSRNVLCTLTDDGVGSIPFRWHQYWSTSTGARDVVATRLRTSYVVAGEGNLGVISTYQVPTPPHP